MCHSLLLITILWLVPLLSTSNQSSLLGVIIRNWQAKGFGIDLGVGAAWLALSVDCFSGHPLSLCLSCYPSISHNKEPSQNETLHLSTQVLLFNLSYVNVGMVHEPGPSRWIIAFCYYQLTPCPLPNPCPCTNTRFFSALTLLLQNLVCPSIRESLHFGEVGNNPLPSTCFKDLLPLAW